MPRVTIAELSSTEQPLISDIARAMAQADGNLLDFEAKRAEYEAMAKRHLAAQAVIFNWRRD